MNKLIRESVQKVVKDILEYESDTFSASGWELNRFEAEAMTAKLIDYKIELGNNIDGIMLSELIDEIRNN